MVSATAIILGTYLYIDGGEIVTWNGTGNGIFGGPGPCTSYYGFGCPGNITLDADNNTYSIDLTTSWTNNTIVLDSIEKAAPVVKAGGLWMDHSNASFYAYGGVIGGPGAHFAMPPNALWEFMPSGGSGSWSEVQLTAQSENFTSLVRTNSAVDTSGNGICFSLGGIVAQLPNEFDQYGQIAVPGMVVYNSSSQIWYNVSSPIDSSGTLVRGAAHFVPAFGPAGLAIFMTGAAPGTGGSPTDTLQTTAVVYIYEPISAKWRTLPVTGSIPPPSEGACIAGAQGEKGSYEIFMYGGQSQNDIGVTLNLGAVYVLSLPSFHWQQTNYTPIYARYGAACNIINRNMIVVGGSVQTQESFDANDNTIPDSIPDPWPLGLGVFDVTDMVWRDSYDAGSGPYLTPKIVKDYYAANPGYPPSLLSDPVVRSWFIKDSNTTNGTAPSPPVHPITSNQSHTGAITGGVIGGTAALALVILLMFCLHRQRQRQSRSRLERPHPVTVDYQKPELEALHHTGYSRPGHLPVGSQQFELETKQRVTESGGASLHEMDGSARKHVP